jgi:hypothetical protein
MEKCLYNSQSSNVAGYCRHHNCAMTVKQIKCKNCLQKQCWHLVKNEDHNWWKQREATKQKRKNRKQAMNEKIGGIA